MADWKNIHVNNGYDKDAYTYYPVLIVGAGESGIAMACQLKRKLGFDQFRLFDRQSGVGGTWWINRYPGVRCDVPSIFYSFSWEPYYTAPELYPEGDSIVKYLHHVTAKYEVQDKIQLNTDVTECVWSEEEQLWICTLSHMAPGTGDLGAKDRFDKIDKEGKDSVYLKQERVKAKIVVSCVGGLVEPKSWPDNIPGHDEFKGELFHAARWPADADLKDKDVVVIGTGCSAAQVVPTILKPPYNVKSVTQLLRSPPWVVPKQEEMGGKEAWRNWAPVILKYNPWLGWLLRQNMAFFSELDWFNLFLNEKKNEDIRSDLEKQMVERLKRLSPEKYHQLLTPNYGIGCKRRIFDADWYKSMHSPKFRLTSQKLDHLTPTGIKLGPGRWYPPESVQSDASTAEEEVKADVIVLANGYETTTWLHPLVVKGRDGRTIHEVWKERGGSQAYLGTAMDGFPNFFMIFGPNIATGHSSVILQTENGVLYALKILAPILKGDATAAEVKKEAEIEYTETAQRQLKNTVFLSGGCGSWYFDPKTGWNAAVYPRSQIDYWWRCLFPNYNHWNFSYTRKGVMKKTAHKLARYSLIIATIAGAYWARQSGTSLRAVLTQRLTQLITSTLQRVQLGLAIAQNSLA